MPADNSSACWAADDPIDQQWDRKFISLPRSLTWGPPTFIDVGGREGPEVEVEPEPEVEPAVVRGHDIWTNRQKQRRLIDAAKADQTDEVTRLLRAEGADVDGTEDGSHHGQLHRTTNLSGTTAEHTAGMTALHHAAMRNYVATMQVLVRAGAEVDKASEDGGTALMLAAELGSTHAVQYLLEQGADWQAKDNFKHTALTIAKHAGRTDSAEALQAWVTDNPHGPRVTIAKVPSLIRAVGGNQEAFYRKLSQGEHPGPHEQRHIAHVLSGAQQPEPEPGVDTDADLALAIALSLQPQKDVLPPDEGGARELEPEPVMPPAQPQPPAKPPTAAEYARHGIAVEALEAFLREHTERGALTADVSTTSDACHALVKPATVPLGWVDEPEPLAVDEHGNDIRSRCWYKHRYRRREGGEAQGTAPAGTRSYCQLLLDDPATAHLVGKPTIFFSHAWLYKFANVVAALRAFVDGLPADAPPQFIWFDCFSIDEHATQALPQEWWASTFAEAIALIGHTVMLLSPWDAPTPLTRAWCLWELHCTSQAPDARFSVCLGPAERSAFEAALLDKHDVIFDVFNSIDVANAQAGDPADRAMILAAVEAAGGCAQLNGLAFQEMRGWACAEARRMVARPQATLGTKTQVAMLFGELKMFEAEAKALYREAVAGFTAHYGAQHVHTLTSKNNLALLLKNEGTAEAEAEAEALYREVVAGFTAHYGGQHVQTLTSKMNLANLLQNEGTVEAEAEAKALYLEVVAGFTAHYGAQHVETLRSKMNLANLLADEGTVEAEAEAKALYREVVAGRTAHYGAQHVETLRSKMNLANLLQNEDTAEAEAEAEAVAEAKALHREVVAGRTVHYGAQHVETLTSKMNLAGLLADEGTAAGVAEAKALFCEVVAGFTAHYGAQHVQTLISKCSMAALFLACGSAHEVADAVALLREGATGFAARLGEAHPHTQRAQCYLARALEQADEAIEEGVPPSSSESEEEEAPRWTQRATSHADM
jgi:hypothetical protein